MLQVTLRLGHNRLHSDGIPFALLADACGGTLSVLELDHNPELNVGGAARTSGGSCALLLPQFLPAWPGPS